MSGFKMHLETKLSGFKMCLKPSNMSGFKMRLETK